MSSLVRSIQKLIWLKQNKTKHNHDGKHGGLVETVTNVADNPYTVKAPVFAWPLTAKGFPPEPELTKRAV